MLERRILILVAALVVLLASAALWNAFVRRPVRASASATPDTASVESVVRTAGPAVDSAPDTARAAAQPAPAPTPAPTVVPPVGAGGPSYIVLLARSEIRRRIRASAGSTYLSDIVAGSTDSILHRWDGRVSTPVRVFFPPTTVANFQPSFLDAVRSAFQRWQEAGVPVRFNLDADSSSAEVRVQWRIQFEGERSGQTDLQWDEDGHLTGGVVTHGALPAPDGGAATLAPAWDARVREGELIETPPDHAVRCFACGHRCPVKPGRRSICTVRFNQDGTLYVPAGYVAALQCAPTEKKPFFHALPGSDTLTFGMLGCDFHCGYCQNWLTSQALRDDTAGVLPTDVTPDDLVRLARRQGARMVGSSYNEPLITAEWAVEVFREARASGLKTAFISNGNATPEVLDYIRPWTDCYKIDLKAMDDRRYRELGGVLQHVLDAIRLRSEEHT